jgi:NADH:ubiquinone oxidoreductase subunit 3 (subunit A)
MDTSWRVSDLPHEVGDRMTSLAFALLVFLVVGSFFLFIHLVIGKFIRPAKPVTEKMTIYECGEPTVGSAWIQFDLRYYVVALLFVIFDVEVAFFFPWAVVFGTREPAEHGPVPGGGEELGVDRALGRVRVLRGAAGRFRVSVAARRHRLGAHHRVRDDDGAGAGGVAGEGRMKL